ncbi:MAG TPA: hypothetical protein VF456_15580 [Vicinamibacterales bacterium]
MKIPDAKECFSVVSCISNDSKVRLSLQQTANAITHDVLIAGDENSNRLAGPKLTLMNLQMRRFRSIARERADDWGADSTMDRGHYSLNADAVRL